ncbi:MAG: cobalt-precorrin 5A hydrolase [Oscillospiraceae bacterium]|nr:cobalt-precorrin 5A hydrolase [Oscillospiraceae bacterium]
MREGFAIVAFTARGRALAETLCAALGGTLAQPDGEGFSLADWTAENFPARQALIFVGAAGIAVRAVAPHLKSKAEDPAVLCVDEYGRHVIPLLSGHLGGANALARRVACLTGGEAVITTATDLNGVFAVDLWAARQGLVIPEPEKIKSVSAKLLRGETVTLSCPYSIRGAAPEHLVLADGGEILVSWRDVPHTGLRLVPRNLTLGVGCKKGTDAQTLEAAFVRFCRERGVRPEAIRDAASIDLKQNEPGLLAFCEAHAWRPAFYCAEELRELDGDFTASAFVEAQTGVDNVCERAAYLRCGGRLVEKKHAAGGVTFALAEYPTELDWSF